MSVRARPCPLWRRIRDEHMATVAIMGMSKNTGKTVTLNHLLACAAADRLGVGVTSIGRDGEHTDAVFSVPKPPVLVWPGTVVATARGTLARAQARTRLLAGTGIDSPLGEIVLVQVQERGEMEVAGASRGHDQQAVIALLKRCGASLVLLDGALGRSQHASPALADGVVLASGAPLGGDIADVLRKTRERLALLGLPEADADARAACAGLFAGAGVGMWRRDGTPVWQAPVASLNAAPALLDHDQGELAVVAVTGAVGRRLWASFEALAERHPGLRVVVADGTRLFVDATDLAALARRGAHLMAWRPIRLVGISLNPTSPLGAPFDAERFLGVARAALPEHVVADVVLRGRHEIPLERIHG